MADDFMDSGNSDGVVIAVDGVLTVAGERDQREMMTQAVESDIAMGDAHAGTAQASSSSSHRPAPLAAPLAAVATASPGPWADGRLHCPLCPDVSYAETPSLMRHLTSRHAGAVVDEEMVALLRALDRGVCSDNLCQGFRRVGTRQCNRCGATTRLRPPKQGDIIQGPPGTSTMASQMAGAPAVSQDVPATPAADQDVSLPQDFSSGIRTNQQHQTPWYTSPLLAEAELHW